MKALLLFFGTLIIFQQANAGTFVDAKALNQKLQRTNAGWIAKDTPISQLSIKDAKHMLGLARKIQPDTQFVDVYGSTRAGLPAKLDWRNVNGVNWVSPILNQANCGSCVAFASIGVMETQLNIANGMPTTHIRLSPQNLFSCGGGYCDFGWMPDEAGQYLQTKGVPDEACMPYLSGATGQDVACSASCADTASRSLKIKNYSMATRSLRNIESVKAALQKGPVVTTLSVYADFLSYAGGVYKHVTGDVLGGHAVSIVGYDDNLKAWIIRNSWGEDWGDKGFAMVSYDDISGVSDETWLYQIPSANGAVSLDSPVDYTFVTNQLTVAATSTYKGTNSLIANITDKMGNKINTANWTSSGTQMVDVSSMADGRYDIQVTAKDALGNDLGTSVRHMFYVVNKAPTLSLTFKGKEVDLGKELTGRIEFDISAHSSSVPMSSLVFHFRGEDGVDHTRTASVVLDEMTMGWRTNVVPSGKYEIWFEGHLNSNSIDQAVESQHLMVTTKN